MVETVETLMIDGTRVNASDGGTFEVYDPSSGEILATVAKATTADVDRAVPWSGGVGSPWHGPIARPRRDVDRGR